MSQFPRLQPARARAPQRTFCQPSERVVLGRRMWHEILLFKGGERANKSLDTVFVISCQAQAQHWYLICHQDYKWCCFREREVSAGKPIWAGTLTQSVSFLTLSLSDLEVKIASPKIYWRHPLYKINSICFVNQGHLYMWSTIETLFYDLSQNLPTFNISVKVVFGSLSTLTKL